MAKHNLAQGAKVGVVERLVVLQEGDLVPVLHLLRRNMKAAALRAFELHQLLVLAHRKA